MAEKGASIRSCSKCSVIYLFLVVECVYVADVMLTTKQTLHERALGFTSHVLFKHTPQKQCHAT